MSKGKIKYPSAKGELASSGVVIECFIRVGQSGCGAYLCVECACSGATLSCGGGGLLEETVIAG